METPANGKRFSGFCQQGAWQWQHMRQAGVLQHGTIQSIVVHFQGIVQAMILVAGSANLDFVVHAGHIPRPGETLLGRDFQTFPGGKGANQAVACARAGGVPTAMLLALGSDDFAKPLETSLLKAGVQLHVRREPSLPTGTAFICVSDDGENAITVAPGANHALAPNDLPPLHGVSHLVMQLETPLDTVAAYARAAHAWGVKVVLNAAPAQPLPPTLLADIDILIVNEGELAVVAGHDGSNNVSIEARLQRVKVPCAVVTLGSEGSCACVDGVITRAAPFSIQPLDTTGAGDAFVGSFVAALSQGASVTQALQMGNAAGALACLKPGAQSSIPTLAEVKAFISSTSQPA
jgi:ribokinase